jgi:hypothetical protein
MFWWLYYVSSSKCWKFSFVIKTDCIVLLLSAAYMEYIFVHFDLSELGMLDLLNSCIYILL